MAGARRTILHVDMDAFYVSVELRRRPELRGLPVVVGGTGRRGVVAAASYEARRYGVHSALSSALARRRCPQAVFLPGDHELYARVSRSVHEIFERFTPVVEPLSLDEAFLDVTGAARLLGDGRAIGEAIRRAVHDELSLTCSVGVAGNKFLAKLASVEAKPVARPSGVEPGPGVFVVEPGAELEYLRPLPVGRLWGVGPVTLTKLERLGVRRVGDLSELTFESLAAAVGAASARHLLELAGGVDDRPVEVDRAVKSISAEETFAHDLFERDRIRREVLRLADTVAGRLRARPTGARTITLKIRFADFRTITRSVTLPEPVDVAPAIVAALEPAIGELDLVAGVRLVGVATSNFGAPVQQLSLLDPPARADGTRPGSSTVGSAGAVATGSTDRRDADRRTAAALDAVRDRFGPASIGVASAVDDHRLRVARPGAQQWGPDHDADHDHGASAPAPAPSGEAGPAGDDADGGDGVTRPHGTETDRPDRRA